MELKNKDEVKDYLKNLLLEYKFSCLSEKNAEGCDLLGDYYSQINKDGPGAAKIWQENCDVRNYARSCIKFGERLLKGRDGYKRDREAALPYFEKACKQNEAKGCYYQGVIYSLGTKVRQPEPAKANSYFEKACNLDYPVSCYTAHYFYLHPEKGMKRDCDKAIKFADMACDKNIHDACNTLTRMYELGECTKVDIKKALHYRKKYDTIVQDMQTPGVHLTA